uniref:Uncharacterized protein n=1 Tax=Rhizophora mucronata TaxID=61149 RepID=A0A2P2PBB3_RHIMU
MNCSFLLICSLQNEFIVSLDIVYGLFSY